MGSERAASRDAVLVLEDGSLLRGTGFGARGTAFGELVFNTGMTGYQESLTDPSYAGQVLMFTYPMIGNYGIQPGDQESRRVWPRAVVVREHCLEPAHRASRMNVHAFLEQAGVPGIAGIDTRALTVKTRERGTLRVIVSNEDPDDARIEELLKEVRTRPFPSEENLVAEVSTPHPTWWPTGVHEGLLDEDAAAVDWAGAQERIEAVHAAGARAILLYDFGLKWNILRSLARDHNVLVVPWDTPAERVKGLQPDAIFLSNGPGDPAHPAIIDGPVAALRELVQAVPVWGICFGHQLLAHAFGGRTFKLPFGHRGANQPVRKTDTHDVIVTSQNHGYAVAGDGFADPDVIVTEVNNNDETVEALAHRTLPVRSCQYHPEAAPGPRDAGPHFDAFRKLLEEAAPLSAPALKRK